MIKFFKRKSVREFRGYGKKQGWYRARNKKFEPYKINNRTKFGFWRNV